jgi:hypothetical protein
METIFERINEMLKNRSIQVDLVKKGNTKDDETDQPQIGFEDKAKIISGVIETSVKKVGLVVCAYVLLDTVRKVAVASLTQ